MLWDTEPGKVSLHMYRYKYNTSYHHKSRRARRTTALAAIVVVAVIVGASFVVYDLLRENTRKEGAASQETLSSVQGTSVNLFKTEYFQFQTDDTWKEIIAESKENKFVYRSFKGPLVEHDFTVEVNPQSEIVALSRTTHVLPVQIESNGTLTTVDGAGEHCGKQWPKDALKQPTRVTQRQVSFVCSPDAVVYQVQVGVVGGTTDLVIPRPGGAKTTYRLTYRNMKFTPDDNMLSTVLATFQAR